MKEHAFRLIRGDDLKDSIIAYCDQHHIKSGVVLCGVGSVNEVCIRKAKAETIFRDRKDYEIVALNGTIARGKAHLHIAVADEKMKTIGGHLMTDTIINTTAEIILMEMETYDFDREFDEATGYDELVVINKHK
ncbi:MAG: PPC domain-containing DNA-binding protein [Erysipelotrichaceae bacterium]|nr:PPC domain-containing DNA-binding protein [Erysipelotrichaceae bacterium]